MSHTSSVDVVLVSPLAEERDALLARLPGYVKLPASDDDIRVYYATTLPVRLGNGVLGEYSLIVMPLAGMGHTEAAGATADAIRHWSPRYVILVGIAGGVAAAGVALGDILISDQVADYELQKIEDKKVSIRWQVHSTDKRLLIAAQNVTDRVWEATFVPRPRRGRPAVRCGPICTGNKVIADESLLTQYRDVWTKLIGVEMEAGGVANAAACAARQPGFFMVRGVSDLADSNKDKKQVRNWRQYACEIAASFTIEFLKSGPFPPNRAIDLSPQATVPGGAFRTVVDLADKLDRLETIKHKLFKEPWEEYEELVRALNSFATSFHEVDGRITHFLSLSFASNRDENLQIARELLIREEGGGGVFMTQAHAVQTHCNALRVLYNSLLGPALTRILTVTEIRYVHAVFNCLEEFHDETLKELQGVMDWLAETASEVLQKVDTGDLSGADHLIKQARINILPQRRAISRAVNALLALESAYLEARRTHAV